MDAAQDLVDRYVAVWHETDLERRRRAIAALWVPEGEHYVGTREVRGYEALEARVTGSHEKNVRDAGNHFRATTNGRVLREVVTFEWAMLASGTDDVLATGMEILIVDEQCRIRVDYQFILT